MANYDEVIQKACDRAGVEKDNAKIFVGNTKIHPLRPGLTPEMKQVQDSIQKLSEALDQTPDAKGTVTISEGNELKLKIKDGIEQKDILQGADFTQERSSYERQYDSLLKESWEDRGLLPSEQIQNKMSDVDVVAKSEAKGFSKDEALALVRQGSSYAKTIQNSQDMDKHLEEMSKVYDFQDTFRQVENRQNTSVQRNPSLPTYTSLLNESLKENGFQRKVSEKELAVIAKRDPILSQEFDTQVAQKALSKGLSETQTSNILSQSPGRQSEISKSIQALGQHLSQIDRAEQAKALPVKVNDYAQKSIEKMNVARQNLNTLAKRTQSFSLKDWAKTQSSNIQKSIQNYVSKQVDTVKNWALSKYPEIRQSVINAVKPFDNKMMEAVADKNLHPYTIEKAASTIATLAGEGKSFSNSKIDIDIGDKGATIKMDGKTVYANQSITAEATPENKNTLGKLNDKAKELTIQASYDVQQGMNKTPALASERSV